MLYNTGSSRERDGTFNRVAAAPEGFGSTCSIDSTLRDHPAFGASVGRAAKVVATLPAPAKKAPRVTAIPPVNYNCRIPRRQRRDEPKRDGDDLLLWKQGWAKRLAWQSNNSVRHSTVKVAKASPRP